MLRLGSAFIANSRNLSGNRANEFSKEVSTIIVVMHKIPDNEIGR